MDISLKENSSGITKIKMDSNKDVAVAKPTTTEFSLFDILIRLIVSILVGIVGYHLRRFFPITLRGFFCQDFSIRFPYRDSTVETNTIFYVSIAILAVLVFVGEFFINKPRDPTNPEFWKLDVLLWKLLQFGGFTTVWMLGAGINFLLFNVIKISVGRLRPNFIAMCQPYTNVTNAKDCLINNSNYFFPGDLFKCNKTNDMNNPRIVDGRCSFYSGHSALSIYFAVFIILYTHIRVFSKSFGSFAAPILPLLIVLYSIIISLGSFVAVSRVFDHKHHPSDVAVGFCVGAAIAILSVFFHRNFFFSAREMKKKDVGKKSSNSVVEVNIISENTRV
uniref:Phosphatidic acid phosphatase type 2/haloperoxidase domain-containing protein n=1 Tax=Meloidogyne enterolobii TaxID=390850 RepID=A0A6V7UV89_MELEN|nr:unnamed protein product [Meloidogyne enterolobii]